MRRKKEKQHLLRELGPAADGGPGVDPRGRRARRQAARAAVEVGAGDAAAPGVPHAHLKARGSRGGRGPRAEGRGMGGCGWGHAHVRGAVDKTKSRRVCVCVWAGGRGGGGGSKGEPVGA